MAFEKGDSVVFHDQHSDYDGETGEVTQVSETMFGDNTYIVEFEVQLLEDQHTTLSQISSGGGFWGSSGGSAGPFQSLYNWVAGGVVGLLSMLGIKKRAGA